MDELLQGRILIVDDEQLVGLKIANVLKHAFYQPEYISSGLDAIALLKEKKFDLVLLDIEMPEMDGFEVCKQITRTEELKEIPVLFLTGYTGPNHILKAFSVGAKDYISKPFNYKELLARVETHIKLKQQNEKLKNANRILENHNLNFFQSISYAKYIQESILPATDKIGESAIDHFVFYQPKDIVSGDFFWFKRIKNLFYIAAVDCTGHGVPGAFMSMLGVTALNQTINSRSIKKPNEVLSKLSKKIKKLLNHNGSLENSNGFDISLSRIDLESRTLDYAGANLPLYYITQNKETQRPEFLIRKPTPRPIGLHPMDYDEFTNHTFKIREGDVFYIFSDGYASQFGGDYGKKMGSKRFRDFLYGIYELPMNEQKTLLEQNVNRWRGALEQVDDILVIGLKF
jgi:phosphoserine phosphatase RsbU/P